MTPICWRRTISTCTRIGQSAVWTLGHPRNLALGSIRYQPIIRSKSLLELWAATFTSCRRCRCKTRLIAVPEPFWSPRKTTLWRIVRIKTTETTLLKVVYPRSRKRGHCHKTETTLRKFTSDPNYSALPRTPLIKTSLKKLGRWPRPLSALTTRCSVLTLTTKWPPMRWSLVLKRKSRPSKTRSPKKTRSFKTW